MKDEAKEILDYLQENSQKDEATKQFVDYITNLQEQLHQASLDIQELTERDIECPSWCDKLTNLQQENEELNKENEKWWAIIKDNEQEIKDLCLENSKLEQENERLRENINNAKEFIENTPLYETTYDYNMEEELEIQNVSDETASNKLLNILNGKE